MSAAATSRGASSKLFETLIPIPITSRSGAAGLVSIRIPHTFRPWIRTSFGHFKRGRSAGDHRAIASATAPPTATDSRGHKAGSIFQERGSTISLDKVLADIRARDLRDTGRNAAPLAMAADAGVLDTSFLSIEAAVIRAIELVERQLALKAAATRGSSLP